MTRKAQLLMFFGAVACMAASLSIYDSIFNNFLSDTFSMSAAARGWLELPRETPGFLVFLTAGVFAAVPLARVGLLAALVYAGGIAGLALTGTSYALMMTMLLISSAGMHLLQPVQASVALALSDDNNRGKRLGQVGAIGTIGAMLGAGFVWLVFDKSAPQYRMGFLCTAGLATVAAVIYGLMHAPHAHKTRSRVVLRKKYWLYYVLELFFGARKQVFITFGPWVLVRVYGQPAEAIAGLFFIAAAIGILFKPLAGHAIDLFGERAVLVADGLILAFVCLGYGYALPLMGGEMEHARLLACACFVADNLLFSLGAGRTVFVSRQTNSPEELTSTLAMGVSINHIISMTIPIAAGAIWAGFGYERVFLAAAVLAIVIAGFASLVPGKRARA
ncbi:MAG: MFS transporter [Nitrospiraceae bacterium]|nr:MFS transporter [Nitrospiraceae bacterium]